MHSGLSTYRKPMIMKKVLVFVVAAGTFVAVLSCTPKMTTTRTQQESGNAVNSLSQDILKYVNRFRAENGRAPLSMNNYMCRQAFQHSKNMATGKTTFSHDGFEQRIDTISAVLGYAVNSAENIAMGQLTAEGVVQGWINSPGHRRNMLGDYTLTGIGTDRTASGMIYFTQIFAKKS